jgi:hypothetical protein
MDRRILIIALLIATVSLPGAAAKKTYSHQEYFEHYEGTQTCLTCHEDEAKAFFHSDHYQWRGETPDVVNSHGTELGKLTMVNDFCTNPVPSWIGEIKNEDGKVVASGCSKCHAGHGLMPSPEMSQEQLENIDCLICHASGYRRGVYQNDDGSWQWKSILWKNQEGLNSVSKRISKPTNTMCLRCHSASGGGPNFKRGDIEYTLADPDPEFDFHMSEEGAGLTCADCHAGQDHRVIGRGSDLVATDSPGQRLTCDNFMCHTSAPHAKALLNQHGLRVECTVCHIPTFAQDEPTDLFRDWSDVHFSEEKGKFAPNITAESDVIPTYAWYNGTSRMQLPKTAVQRDENGTVLMAIPEGSKDDPDAKISAFKVHRAKLPVLDGKNWLLPITVDELYVHGDVNRAVQEAAEALYGIHDAQYTWAETIRYMKINHEVRVSPYALGCLDCHGPDGRLDWLALGYEGDPLADCLPTSN